MFFVEQRAFEAAESDSYSSDDLPDTIHSLTQKNKASILVLVCKMKTGVPNALDFLSWDTFFEGGRGDKR